MKTITCLFIQVQLCCPLQLRNLILFLELHLHSTHKLIGYLKTLANWTITCIYSFTKTASRYLTQTLLQSSLLAASFEWAHNKVQGQLWRREQGVVSWFRREARREGRRRTTSKRRRIPWWKWSYRHMCSPLHFTRLHWIKVTVSKYLLIERKKKEKRIEAADKWVMESRGYYLR